jgi:1,5-anhydro-D-fructose reductase (1,5-anhydro-D-mannitol-forming)
MRKRLKVAVLSFAHGHAGGYLRHLASRGDIAVAAADPDSTPTESGRGRQAADALGVPYFESYEQALAWGPDAVVVCSENSKHRELVELAAGAGAHVLCEKPLATTDADARAMVDAAERAGVALMVAFPVRFSPSFVALRKSVREGRLGDILSIVGTNNGKLPLDRTWFTDPQLAGGGSIVDHVVHCADLIDSLLDAKATSVFAVANGILHSEAHTRVETGGLATIRYEGGIVATIDCSWSQPDSAPNWGGLTLEVVGTRGSVRIAPFAAHVDGFGGDGALWLPYGADSDAVMIDEFLSAVTDGRRPQPDGGVGIRTTAIMTAALRSARSGKVEPIS